MSGELSPEETETRNCPCPRCCLDSEHERHLCIHHDTESRPCSCHLKHGKHLCLVHEDLRAKVRKLEKVAAELNRKLKTLKNSRSTAQEENKYLIQQSNQVVRVTKSLISRWINWSDFTIGAVGLFQETQASSSQSADALNDQADSVVRLVEEIRQKTAFTKNSMRCEEEIAIEAKKWSQIWLSENGKKILADKRLLENAQQVKVIEQQIEYTHRLIEHKRKLISIWQSTSMQKIHKEDQLVLEQENMDTERKMVEWFKENRRLLRIFEAMKDREIEMIFAAERCLQRNRQARGECSEMQSRILAISRTLDERSIRNTTNTSSSSITLHSRKSASAYRQPAGASLSESSTNSSTHRIQRVNYLKQRRMNSERRRAESTEDVGERRFLELMIKRCNFGLLDCADTVVNRGSCSS